MSDDQESKSNSDTPSLNEDAEITQGKSNENYSLSGDESDSFPISSSGNYIKKIRERFEQSNSRINKELIRVDPNELARSMMDKFSKTNQSIYEETPQSRRSRRSVVSSRVYDDTISQIDTESLAPSRKVKRKKIKKLKRVVSKHSVIDETCTVVSHTKSQPGDVKSPKRTKVVHNKAVKKQLRKMPFRNKSKEHKIDFSVSRQASQESIKIDVVKPKVERNRSYTKINLADNKVDVNAVEDYFDGTSKPSDGTKEKAEDLLLKNLNLILDPSNIVVGNRIANNLGFYKRPITNNIIDMDIEDERSQLLKRMNSYELPTIASKMRSVNRTTGIRQPEPSRIPFVVGTSITVTNNLFLLKQQIASKLKTYCLSPVNEEQLNGWNVNSLRLLIQSIEKLSSVHKLRTGTRSKQAFGQSAEEEETEYENTV